jgi:hypothetical protein
VEILDCQLHGIEEPFVRIAPQATRAATDVGAEETKQMRRKKFTVLLQSEAYPQNSVFV